MIFAIQVFVSSSIIKKYPDGYLLEFHIKEDGLQVTVCWAQIESRSKFLVMPTWAQ